MSKIIVVAGSLAQKPERGGHTWVFLQYLLGFKRLGWEVLFVDQLEPGMCRDAAGRPCPVEESLNLRYLAGVMERFGLGGSFSLIYNGGERFFGVPRERVLEGLKGAAFLLDVMGYVRNEEMLGAAARRVFLDIDPGFGQMWCELGLHDPFDGFDDHVTIGENIGREGCAIPACGLDWITIRQPVVLDSWARQPGEGSGCFTGVASWRGAYGPVEYRGKTYGLRVHEFRKFARLPRLTGHPFQLALDIHPAEVSDLELLSSGGWTLVDPKVVAGDPWSYMKYVRDSKAEFMVAKNMYVQSNSGWFSDRSICYLASGRPVLAQDTGIEELYPVGRGLLTFATPEEAASGVEEICGNYARHARAARAIAEDYFDSDKVLSGLLRKLNVI